MYRLITQINYFYIFIVLIYAPLQSYLLHFDGMHRSLFFLTIPVLITNILFNSSFKKLLFYKPIVFWGIWVTYSTINSFIKGSPYDGVNIIFFIGDFFVAYIVMILVCNEYLKDTSKLLKFLTVTISIYVLFGLSSFNTGILGTERFLAGELGNKFPLNIVFLIFFISFRFRRNELKFWNAVIMLLFLLLLIVLSGTRKALGGSLIIIICTVLSFIHLQSYKSTLMSIGAIIILFFGFQYVMNNTLIGERMNEVEEAALIYNTTDYPILNLLGDRSHDYILGWEVFTENSITGIGLGNFREYTFSNYAIHSEYMVQLAECGLIGSLLFLLFIFWIGITLFRYWREYPQLRNNSLIIIGGFGAILFIGLTSWTYSNPIYFASYGIIIAYLRQSKYEEYEDSIQ